MAYKLEHPVRTPISAMHENSQRKFLERMGCSGGTLGIEACSCPGMAGSGRVLAQLWTAAAKSS